MASMNIKSDDMASSPVGEAEYDASPCIYLSDDQVEALGIKSATAGQVLNLKVVAKATRVTSTQEEPDEAAAEGNSPDVTLTLCLTDIEVVGTAEKSIADTLYGA